MRQCQWLAAEALRRRGTCIAHRLRDLLKSSSSNAACRWEATAAGVARTVAALLEAGGAELLVMTAEAAPLMAAAPLPWRLRCCRRCTGHGWPAQRGWDCCCCCCRRLPSRRGCCSRQRPGAPARQPPSLLGRPPRRQDCALPAAAARPGTGRAPAAAVGHRMAPRRSQAIRLDGRALPRYNTYRQRAR